jgi:hypothetical protein
MSEEEKKEEQNIDDQDPSVSENENEEPIEAKLSEAQVEPLTRTDFDMSIIGKWTRIHARNPPKRRSNHTAFLYRKAYLYIVGGVDITERKQSDIYRVKLTSHYPEWEKVDVEGMIKIAYHAGVYYKGIYYIIGGQNEEIRTLNTILKFKVSENKMLDPIEPDENTFPKIESHTVNLYNGNAIVYGGNCGKNFNKNVYSINLENGEIKNLTENLESDKMPIPRADHAAEIQGDSLYVYGGYGPDNVYLDDVWCFNLGSNSWTQIKFGDEDQKKEEEEKKEDENNVKKEENEDKKENEKIIEDKKEEEKNNNEEKK